MCQPAYLKVIRNEKQGYLELGQGNPVTQREQSATLPGHISVSHAGVPLHAAQTVKSLPRLASFASHLQLFTCLTSLICDFSQEKVKRAEMTMINALLLCDVIG